VTCSLPCGDCHLLLCGITPPFIFDGGFRAGGTLLPPCSTLSFTKYCEVLRFVFPIVARGDVRRTAVIGRSTSYDEGPGPSGPPFGMDGGSVFRGDRLKDPRNENDGESKPKFDIKPSVSAVLGFVKRENLFVSDPVESRSLGSSSNLRFSLDIEEGRDGFVPKLGLDLHCPLADNGRCKPASAAGLDLVDGGIAPYAVFPCVSLPGTPLDCPLFRSLRRAASCTFARRV